MHTRRLTPLLLAALAACITVSQVVDSPPAPATEFPEILIPTRGDNLRLAVTGDVGENPSIVASAIRRVHQTKPFDAVVLLGDNFYSCGVSSEKDPQWQKIRDSYSLIGVPILPVLGNHDYGNPKGSAYRIAACGNPDPEAQVRATGQIRNWQFPGRSYVVEAGEVDLLMLDTTPLAENWTRSVMGAATSQVILQNADRALSAFDRRWRIVAGHHTIYGSGRHTAERPGGEGTMRRLHDVLLRHDVDLYMCGHDHHLELISFERDDPKQPVFLISGAGSRIRRVIPRSRTGLPTLFPMDAKSFLGFAVVEITNGALTVQFFDAKAAPKSELFTFRKPVVQFMPPAAIPAEGVVQSKTRLTHESSGTKP